MQANYVSGLTPQETLLPAMPSTLQRRLPSCGPSTARERLLQRVEHVGSRTIFDC
jgi:hypothetical protein